MKTYKIDKFTFKSDVHWTDTDWTTTFEVHKGGAVGGLPLSEVQNTPQKSLNRNWKRVYVFMLRRTSSGDAMTFLWMWRSDVLTPPVSAFRQPSPTCSTAVPAQHLQPSVIFQSLAPRSGTVSRILFGTQRSVQTVSDVYLKRICLLDISASSALEVLDGDKCAI